MNRELIELPEGWSFSSIETVTSHITDGTHLPPPRQDRGVPLLSAKDIVDGRLAPENPRLVTEAYFRSEQERTQLSEGDVLVTIVGSIGRTAVVPAAPRFALQRSVAILKPSEVTSDYLAHYLRSPEAASYYATAGRGTAQQGLYLRDLKRMPIPVPSKSQQRRISVVLDNVEARRRGAHEHIRGAIRALQRFRQATLAAACSGQLTIDWREEHPDRTNVAEALRILPSTSRRTRRPSSSESEVPLPDLPDGYVWSTIGDASELVEYGTNQKSEANTSGIPVLRMGNIQGGQLELDDLKYCQPDDEIRRLILRDGDLLFNRTNSPELVGKSAVFHESREMTFASYLIRVRFPQAVADPDFVSYWINSAWGRLWAMNVKTDGVSQSNINGTKLAAMPLPLPPIEEQREVVRRADAMLALADGLLARIAAARRRVDVSGQAILTKAFRGGLVTS